MNPSADRHQFSGHLPQLNLSSDKVPSLQPQTLSESNLRPPPMVEALIKNVRWDWLFDVACNLSAKFRALGMMCPGSANEMKSAMLMGSEPGDDATLAAAHAWVVALAQRAAIEIRQLELLDEPRIVLPADMVEVTCVAFLATTGNSRGSGRRLTRALRALAQIVTQDCENGATVPGAGMVQFVHGLPVQMVSPVGGEMAMPVAAVRIRFRGFEVSEVLAALKSAMQNAATEGKAGDVLVLSNLWTA
jgi:hypothetical protein